MKAGNHQPQILLFLPIVVMAACLTLSRAALAQEPPGDSTVYLPIAATFHVTQPIAAGGAHSCAILPTGIVRCWGANDKGQLGDGTTISSTLPVTVQGLPPATSIAAGENTTCASAGEGIYCWGNRYGTRPLQVQYFQAVELVIWPNVHLDPYAPPTYNGDAEVCALTAGGSIQCWVSPLYPYEVEGPHDFATLGSGVLKCATRRDGTIACWGGDFPLPNPMPEVSDALSVATYVTHDVHCGSMLCQTYLILCVARASGSTMCASFYVGQPEPLQIASSQPTLAAGDTTRLYAWGKTSCHLQADGAVVCGGNPENGECGLDSAHLCGRPVLGMQFSALSVRNHACAYRSDGAVWCWGPGGPEALGNASIVEGSDTLVEMPVAGSRAVDARAGLTCNIDAAWQVSCWGQTRWYVHYSSPGMPGFFPPRPIDLGGPASAVAVGSVAACALVNDQGISCWRPYMPGEPPIAIPESANARALSVAGDEGCFIGSDSRVRCWRHEYPAGEERPILSFIEGASRARALNLAGEFGEVIRYPTTDARAFSATADGRVEQWDFDMFEVPGDAIPIEGINDARQLSASRTSACALRADGRVACWGNNGHGQLGDGTTLYRETPVTLQGLTDVIDLEGDPAEMFADSRSCALRKDGAVLCWGDSGQAPSVPTERFRVEGATDLAVGSSHICVTAHNKLYCQGSNLSGQLARNPGWTPVRVEGLEP